MVLRSRELAHQRTCTGIHNARPHQCPGIGPSEDCPKFQPSVNNVLQQLFESRTVLQPQPASIGVRVRLHNCEPVLRGESGDRVSLIVK